MSGFVPPGSLVHPAPPVRQLMLSGHPRLPDGEYDFVDHYCIDPECDCRKTVIDVHYDGEVVLAIDYGWESPEWYVNWMGDDEDGIASDMSGASISPLGPLLIHPHAMLEQFESMLDDEWIGKIKENYRLVKDTVATKLRQHARRNRRRPGSKGRRRPGTGGWFR